MAEFDAISLKSQLAMPGRSLHSLTDKTGIGAVFLDGAAGPTSRLPTLHIWDNKTESGNPTVLLRYFLIKWEKKTDAKTDIDGSAWHFRDRQNGGRACTTEVSQERKGNEKNEQRIEKCENNLRKASFFDPKLN